MEGQEWRRLAARLRELVGRGGLGGGLPVPIPVGGGGRGVVGLAGGGGRRPAAGTAARWRRRSGCAHGDVLPRELVGNSEAAAAAGEVGSSWWSGASAPFLLTSGAPSLACGRFAFQSLQSWVIMKTSWFGSFRTQNLFLLFFVLF